MNESAKLQADSAGFLTGGKPVNPSRPELALFQRLREELRAFRAWTSKKSRQAEPQAEAGSSQPALATPRLFSQAIGAKPTAAPGTDQVGTPGAQAKTVVVKIVQAVATPQRVLAPGPAAGPTAPKLDAQGKRALCAVAKPRLAKAGEATTTTAPGMDGEPSKIGKLLGDIRDKIGAPNLSGSEEVDPNIKAAQEIAGVAGGALQGVKALGGVLGAVATPVLNGVLGKPKANDAPTPWFKRFFNELRGLRREESVFNRAQLRTLKEIEAKPAEGKGGGLMGGLMMLIGPLIAAIGGAVSAAMTAGFGLLAKLPGAGLLAKLATGLMPAALLAKRPITQPITQPAGAGKVSAGPKTGQPGDAAPKPGLLSRAGSGAMGVLKRVPLLGAALAAIGAGAGVFDSESNTTTSRAEKDRATGKAVGGGGGAIAGMLSGGAAGAAIGALAGPVGVAIGGVVGAVAGGFFGEKAGAVVGETVGAWVADLRQADIPGLIARAWTSTTGSMTTAWAATTKWMEGKWEDSLAAKAVQKVKDAAMAAANAVGAAKSAVNQGAAEALSYGKDKAGQAGDALKNSAMGRGAGWVLGQFTGGKRKAAETAQNYAAGNIAGLDDAHTRALVASTALNESSGGQINAMNKQGYMGRYQAGASWLASAGLMRGGDKGVKAAMKADGFNNEWKWAEAGGMSRFLGQDANWVDGMSRAKYLASAGAQDAAFKAATDKNHADLLKRGVIKPGDSQDVVAGYLKTAHIAGPGGALAVSRGGQGASDANGTSARKYFDDMASDRHGFNQAFKNAQGPATAANRTIAALPNYAPVVMAGTRPIPKMPAFAVEPPKIPDFQPVTQGLASAMNGGAEQRPSVIVVGNKTPAGRDLSNRPLAHIVTGGLSGWSPS